MITADTVSNSGRIAARAGPLTLTAASLANSGKLASGASLTVSLTGVGLTGVLTNSGMLYAEAENKAKAKADSDK